MKKHRRFHYQEVLECFHPCSLLESTSNWAPMTNFPSKPRNPHTQFQISFYTFFLFRASLAHARPDVAQPSRTLCFCSRTRFFQKVFLLSNSNLRARESSVRLRDFSRSLITTISLVFPSFLVLAWNTSNLLKPSFFMTCSQLY